MQNVNRDTLGFAIKCSNITILTIEYEGYSFGIATKDIEVFKNPITDHGKVSKKGKVTTYYNDISGEYFAGTVGYEPLNEFIYDVLETVYKNGKMIKEYSLDDVRNNSIKGI